MDNTVLHTCDYSYDETVDSAYCVWSDRTLNSKYTCDSVINIPDVKDVVVVSCYNSQTDEYELVFYSLSSGEIGVISDLDF